MKASGPERASSWQFAVALVARSPAVALVARGEEDLNQHGHFPRFTVALVARGEGGLDRTPLQSTVALVARGGGAENAPPVHGRACRTRRRSRVPQRPPT